MPKTADQALYEVLAAHAGLTALLGSGEAFRCYPVEAPEGAQLPLVVFQALAINPANSHDQGSVDADRLDECEYQLTAVALTPLQAAAVLYQARIAIEQSSALKGVQVGERSLQRSEDAQAHAKSADFHFWNNPDAT